MSSQTERLNTFLAGRYQVDRQIGVGGMATVYLAQDTRHGRRVALKVLRPELAAVIGAERFLAEIKTTAGLQHPHILPLHDSGEADGTVFYVMPFVEGETLRDRIKREHQLPVDEAVRLATQVASALDYAHRQHVIHRDIKPENILLQDGQALVADFGIALAVSKSEGSTRMTETGMSLGTPHYMAPEQAMGEREITARADVYALGCVLYEMLTGEPPFTGATAQAIVARAMTESPRGLSIQRHTVPAHVEAAVLTSLEKLPADRFASAGEFAAALANPQFTGVGTATTTRVAARASRRQTQLTIALGVALVASLAALVGVLARPTPPRPVLRFAVDFPPGQTPFAVLAGRLSPQGTHLAYLGPAAAGGGGLRLWIKSAARRDADPVAGGESAFSFVFSPDGQSIAFISTDRQVKTLPITGGTAAVLADSAENAGIAWLDDGTIAYTHTDGGLRRVAEGGGKAETIVPSDSTVAFNPEALPGSRGLLYLQCPKRTACTGGPFLHALELDSRKSTRVVSGVRRAVYVGTGHIVYVREDDGLLALPFDLGALSGSGEPVAIADAVSDFDVAVNGTMITRATSGQSRAPTYNMVWVDRTGRESLIDSSWVMRMADFGANVGWALSPDGTRIAIGLFTEAGDDIWIKQLPRGPLSRLSYDSAPDFRPRWSRDGKSVLFVSTRSATIGSAALYRRAADATGSDTLVFSHRAGIFEAAFAPDGKTLALRTGGVIGQTGGRDISIAQAGTDTAAKPLIATRFDEEAIALSPDGKWIAYESNETGRTEVYLRPFPNADGGKRQVSTDGGVAPLWARNGRELFYVNGTRSMVAVPVVLGEMPKLGEPKTLFKLREELYLADREFYTPFDIAPDGRFLMARRVARGETRTEPLVITLNWLEELKARVGKR